MRKIRCFLYTAILAQPAIAIPVELDQAKNESDPVLSNGAEHLSQAFIPGIWRPKAPVKVRNEPIERFADGFVCGRQDDCVPGVTSRGISASGYGVNSLGLDNTAHKSPQGETQSDVIFQKAVTALEAPGE